jgi:aspartyl-tRNA(Asn)/glutamyl-tRNA(Gln) amidotransferase subunit B
VELPLSKKQRFETELGIKPELTDIIVEEKETADFFEEALALGGDPVKVANWLTGQVQAQLKRIQKELPKTLLSPKRLVDLIEMVENGRINASRGKQALEIIFDKNLDPETIVEENGWEQIGDASAIQGFVDEVIAENPGPVKQIEAGEQKPLGFLVGQVMKLSKGQADPKEVMKTLKERFGL